ncbi:CpaD family pilus assembly protein [Mesorhizobium sp. RMAD-H1]|uniref:CpaD family pilus assembly protein n=1 Tax=Mesorhizobium sp. RMAD-H1 TaxID=2587065 RepID=UPI00160D7AEA|nr:CpaD family pilus assembly protein [Mesorhizobium sp. RMAD-H1]MBB2971965.1 pilus assembly protein CpaD [Mesorhizobium sp. RMAD-H1]
MLRLRRSFRSRPALALLAALAISGCANRQNMTVSALPDDYRTNHPITIAERERVVDIPVAHGDRRLSPTQRSIVQNALVNYRANGSGMVYIMLPSGSPNEAAAYRLSTEIADVLRKGGVRPSNIATESYAVQSPDAAPVRISYYAMTAATTPCGRWPDDMLNTAENRHYTNFGCANQNNLAAQIANPADLLGPRAPGEIDATRRGNVISDYQDHSQSVSEIWQEPRSEQAEY